MKLLVYKHLPRTWTQLLTDAGLSSVHMSAVESDVAKLGSMPYAAENNLILLTDDERSVDVLQMTANRKPSIVVFSKDALLEAIGPQVVAAVKASEEALDTGAVLWVQSDSFDLHLLPLPPIHQLAALPSIEALAAAWTQFAEDVGFPQDFDGVPTPAAHRGAENAEISLQNYLIDTGDTRLFSLMRLLGPSRSAMDKMLWPEEYEQEEREIAEALREANKPGAVFYSHEEVSQRMRERYKERAKE